MRTRQPKESSVNIDRVVWPYARLGEAIEALGQKAGFPVVATPPPVPSETFATSQDDLDEWMTAAALHLGIRAEPVDLAWPDILSQLRSGDPCICRLPASESPAFLAVSGKSGRNALLLAPDLSEHRLPAEDVREMLCGHLTRPLREEATAMSLGAGIKEHRIERIADALIDIRLHHYPINGWWKLSPPSEDRFFYRLKQSHARRDLLSLIGLHTFRYLLWIFSWWLLGNGALNGHIDPGWLTAWALLLITIIPLRTAEVKIQGRLSLKVGAALKERLLSGAVKMNPEHIRRQGYGELLGRVHESEAIESLAFGGGLSSALALIEIVLAIGVLINGAGGIPHALLLLGWIAVVIGLLFILRRRLARWTARRIAITGSLVENMAGHRTRLVQELPEDRHRDEDRLVEEYLKSSQAKDYLHTLISSIGSRGWTVVGLAGLAPAFIAGEHGGTIAVSIGGILLAGSGIAALLSSISQLISAEVSWHQIAPLFKAAAIPQQSGQPDVIISKPQHDESPSFNNFTVRGEQLVFRHHTNGEAAIQGASIRISEGEKILLEGPSGGGKSTLASLLLGLREPESGLLLMEGLDYDTIGPLGWRNRVVAAPQFHENHVFIGTFAFNLLMGRRWPPREQDLADAMEVCTGLGLGGLLERMPGGMSQMVGETGWQLSHGERSRLFIARALLQRSKLIILDESFGSLDPETLQSVVEYVTKRSQTLLAIAHP